MGRTVMFKGMVGARKLYVRPVEGIGVVENNVRGVIVPTPSCRMAICKTRFERIWSTDSGSRIPAHGFWLTDSVARIPSHGFRPTDSGPAKPSNI